MAAMAAGNPASDRTMCGWRVRSEIPLPETLPWSGDADRAPDIHIRVGEVPDSIPGAACLETLPVQANYAGEDGTYLLKIRGVGRYLVPNGSEIVVAPDCPLDQPDLRIFLLVNCLGALALHRRLAPMHGAAVRINGRAMAIFATSGQGKSTLTAALSARGHRFLTEDVCVLDLEGGPDGRIGVVPTLPLLRLWQDALDRLGINRDGLTASRFRRRKFLLSRPDWFHDRSEPLAGVVLMAEAQPPKSPEGLTPARGASAIGMISQFAMRPMVARSLGAERRIVGAAVDLVRQRRAFRLGVRRGWDNLDGLAAQIEALADQLPE